MAETEQFVQWNIHKSIFKAAMKGDLVSVSEFLSVWQPAIYTKHRALTCALHDLNILAEETA